MLRRINQPATEPMEAVLPEYLAMAATEGEDEPRPPELAATERERERECRRLGKKTTDIHSWNRRTGKRRLVLFSFAPSLF